MEGTNSKYGYLLGIFKGVSIILGTMYDRNPLPIHNFMAYEKYIYIHKI